MNQAMKSIGWGLAADTMLPLVESLTAMTGQAQFEPEFARGFGAQSVWPGRDAHTSQVQAIRIPAYL